MKIKDMFEIKQKAGHGPGLVVVLDALLAEDPSKLIGQMACIWLPSGDVLEVRIDEAKEHGRVNSLFFRKLAGNDIPVGCEIKVTQSSPVKSTKPSPSIVS